MGLTVGSARANMRAPVSRPSPSTALGGPAPELTVLKEHLEVACNNNGCRVDAKYFLEAGGAGSWRLAFVLPKPGKVTVRSGGTALLVTSQPVVWNDPLAKTYRPGKQPRLHFMPKMQQAVFDVALPAGQSALEVSYRQAWGQDERKFEGYFQGWLSTRTIRYELWPLRQWRLARDFALTFLVRIEDDGAGGALLRVAKEPVAPLTNLTLLPRGDDGVWRHQWRWGKKFPARLEVVAGPKEALATYGIRLPAGEGDRGPEQGERDDSE